MSNLVCNITENGVTVLFPFGKRDFLAERLIEALSNLALPSEPLDPAATVSCDEQGIAVLLKFDPSQDDPVIANGAAIAKFATEYARSFEHVSNAAVRLFSTELEALSLRTSEEFRISVDVHRRCLSIQREISSALKPPSTT